MTPREGWSLDRSWSSASSIKSVLKTKVLLSIIFNDTFSFSAVFYECLCDSGPSQQQVIYRDECLFSDKAESGKDWDLKDQNDDLVNIAGLGNPLLTSVHTRSLERHFRCGKSAKPAPAGAPQVRICPG